MAPEEKIKKRKAQPRAVSSEVPQKKSKKQKTTKDAALVAAAAAEEDTASKSSVVPLQVPIDSNTAVVKAKSRKRAADFLSDNADEAKLAVKETSEFSAAVKSKKKRRAMGRAGDTNSDIDPPAAQADGDKADILDDTKPKKQKKTKTSMSTASEKPVKATTGQQAKFSGSTAKRAIKVAALDGEILTADGANGILEHSNAENFEVTAPIVDASASMQAEAQRTVDKETVDEVATEDDSDDQGAALLAGFDSDGEDVAEDEGLDPANMQDLELDKKQRKKLRQAGRKESKDGPGVVYIGRIPHGFHENEMRQYFSQFGTIANLRLSRNRKTGASKHFAFVEFESNEVAKIVAQTMDNYLMFGHILKCKYAPAESLHPDTWKGANKRFKQVPYNKIEKRKLEEPKTKDQWTTKIAREQGKRAAKAEKMKSMGYEYDMPELQSVEQALEQKRLAQQEASRFVEPAGETEPPTGAIEPRNGVPNDALALATGKKSKKSKTNAAAAVSTVLEAVPEAEIATRKPKMLEASKKAVIGAESAVPEVKTVALTEMAQEITQPVAGKKTKKEKKTVQGATAPVDVVSSAPQPNVEPPKFAFHPDEIEELANNKSKGQKKSRGTAQAAAQMQLNSELNDAAAQVKKNAVDSPTEIAASSAVLPTHSGGAKKAKGGKYKKQKRASDALVESESANVPKMAKRTKKSAIA